MKKYFADLHIHIGMTERGTPVKISASNKLSFYHIAQEASQRKGMDIVGIIDAHAPDVLHDIDRYLERGEMIQLEEGGIRYQNTSIMLGCEIEVRQEGYGPAHVLAYFPSLQDMKSFSSWLSARVTNINLSTQRLYTEPQRLQEKVKSYDGLIIPAHIFTPYKSVFGSGARRVSEIFDPQFVDAVELGLSSDTAMAGGISELDAYPFLTNSDAHSLSKIGREYNELKLEQPNFTELKKAIRAVDGRQIAANYGLNPHLGKYHRSYCGKCEKTLPDSKESVETEHRRESCPNCGSHKLVKGVFERINALSDRVSSPQLKVRPPYIYQAPLEFIHGLGPAKLKGLLQRFDTEMNILHHVSYDKLEDEVGERIAKQIIGSRKGTLSYESGGGGIYGKIIIE